MRALQALTLPLIAAIALAGCDEGAPSAADNSASADVNGFAWASAPENSHAALRENFASSEFNSTSGGRCWPREGRYDCIFVSQLIRLPAVDTSGVNVSRHDLAALPSNEPDSTLGYGCSIVGFGIVTESITGPSGTLVSHRIAGGANEAPWTAAYVDRFMRENRVEGRRHFNCQRLSRLIQQGSLSTISTTAVRYADVMQ